MTTVRGALRPALSRDSLLASARHEVRRSRGRRRWLVESRLLPVGVPLGLAVGALLLVVGERAPRAKRRRSARAWTRAAGAALVVVGASWAGALAEWELRERNHRRRERLGA